MDVQDMRIFARVAAVQNLSLVGSELNLTPGTISKRVQSLENDFGAKLFERNTRSIRITEEGQRLLEHVQRILLEIDQARAEINQRMMQPRGTLRVATICDLGDQKLPSLIAAFMRQHEEVDVQVDVTGRNVNLQDDGFDVVIRRGAPANSGLIRKVLRSDPHVLVASSSYLRLKGAPAVPECLSKHQCLILGDAATWEFECEGARSFVRVSGRMRTDCSELILTAAMEGLGVARLSRIAVERALLAGHLKQVLPAYQVAADTAICAFYPSSKHVLPRLRVFLDFLADGLRSAKHMEPGCNGSLMADHDRMRPLSGIAAAN